MNRQHKSPKTFNKKKKAKHTKSPGKRNCPKPNEGTASRNKVALNEACDNSRVIQCNNDNDNMACQVKSEDAKSTRGRKNKAGWDNDDLETATDDIRIVKSPRLSSANEYDDGRVIETKKLIEHELRPQCTGTRPRPQNTSARGSLRFHPETKGNKSHETSGFYGARGIGLKPPTDVDMKYKEKGQSQMCMANQQTSVSQSVPSSAGYGSGQNFGGNRIINSQSAKPMGTYTNRAGSNTDQQVFNDTQNTPSYYRTNNQRADSSTTYQNRVGSSNGQPVPLGRQNLSSSTPTPLMSVHIPENQKVNYPVRPSSSVHTSHQEPYYNFSSLECKSMSHQEPYNNFSSVERKSMSHQEPYNQCSSVERNGSGRDFEDTRQFRPQTRADISSTWSSSCGPNGSFGTGDCGDTRQFCDQTRADTSNTWSPTCGPNDSFGTDSDNRDKRQFCDQTKADTSKIWSPTCGPNGDHGGALLGSYTLPASSKQYQISSPPGCNVTPYVCTNQSGQYCETPGGSVNLPDSQWPQSETFPSFGPVISPTPTLQGGFYPPFTPKNVTNRSTEGTVRVFPTASSSSRYQSQQNYIKQDGDGHFNSVQANVNNEQEEKYQFMWGSCETNLGETSQDESIDECSECDVDECSECDVDISTFECLSQEEEVKFMNPIDAESCGDDSNNWKLSDTFGSENKENRETKRKSVQFENFDKNNNFESGKGETRTVQMNNFPAGKVSGRKSVCNDEREENTKDVGIESVSKPSIVVSAYRPPFSEKNRPSYANVVTASSVSAWDEKSNFQSRYVERAASKTAECETSFSNFDTTVNTQNIEHASYHGNNSGAESKPRRVLSRYNSAPSIRFHSQDRPKDIELSNKNADNQEIKLNQQTYTKEPHMQVYSKENTTATSGKSTEVSDKDNEICWNFGNKQGTNVDHHASRIFNENTVSSGVDTSVSENFGINQATTQVNAAAIKDWWDNTPLLPSPTPTTDQNGPDDKNYIARRQSDMNVQKGQHSDLESKSEKMQQQGRFSLGSYPQPFNSRTTKSRFSLDSENLSSASNARNIRHNLESAKQAIANRELFGDNPWAQRHFSSPGFQKVVFNPDITTPKIPASNQQRRSTGEWRDPTPWPKEQHGNWSIDNCVIAGDSITRALATCPPTKLVHVVAAPGCTILAPYQTKWLERFWNPLEERLTGDPSVRFLVLHIGTNDISINVNTVPATVVQRAVHLFRKIWNVRPDVVIIFSSILRRFQNAFNASVSESLTEINQIIYDVNDQIEAHCKDNPRLRFLDNHDSFRNSPMFYSKDGLHLADAGTHALGVNIINILETELQKLAESESEEVGSLASSLESLEK